VNLDRNEMWNTIWRMRIPRTVQMFIWRACNEILPTMEKLHSRPIVSDPICPICRVPGESSAHVIWRCLASVAVWAECNWRIQKIVIPEGEYLSIFEHLSNRLGVEDLELVAVIAQKLWLRRNTVVYGGAFLNPICLIKCATEELEDFHLATDNGQPVSQAMVNRSQSWVKSPDGKLKINWDATVNKKNKIIGVGIVIQDHKGVVRATMCSSKPYVSDPTVAEALGARQAVELCRNLGFQNILLEGDAKEIVSEIASGGAFV
jgi:hypothetical protein